MHERMTTKCGFFFLFSVQPSLQFVMEIPLSTTVFGNWTKADFSSQDAQHLGTLLLLHLSSSHYVQRVRTINPINKHKFISICRTLQELVEHYSKDSDGLCVNLRLACVQVNFIFAQFILLMLLLVGF